MVITSCVYCHIKSLGYMGAKYVITSKCFGIYVAIITTIRGNYCHALRNLHKHSMMIKSVNSRHGTHSLILEPRAVHRAHTNEGTFLIVQNKTRKTNRSNKYSR